MSRASGAGAYSHGIACPSPKPQLFGRWSGAGTTLVLLRSAMARHYVTALRDAPVSSRRPPRGWTRSQ